MVLATVNIALDTAILSDLFETSCVAWVYSAAFRVWPGVQLQWSVIGQMARSGVVQAVCSDE